MFAVIGVVVAFSVSYWLSAKSIERIQQILAGIGGLIIGEVGMLATSYVLYLVDPIAFPPQATLLSAIGNIWIALVGAVLGAWQGRKKAAAAQAETP